MKGILDVVARKDWENSIIKVFLTAVNAIFVTSTREIKNLFSSWMQLLISFYEKLNNTVNNCCCC